ncbi:hypothetical protein DXG03_007477, partial [Asterophora parasitica]
MVTSAPVPNTPLPTLESLNASVPTDLDAKAVAKAWFAAFAKSAERGDAQSVAALLVTDAFWRDMLALTWDFRTFSGISKITQFLNDRLGSVHPRAFVLRDDAYLGLQHPYPDLAWINLMFDFETDAGVASGIARLVPNANGEWKAHTVFTNLEDLKGFPEKTGPLRDHAPNHGKWVDDRKREAEFADTQPTVLIVGGGQSGLTVAARLKVLGIQSLVVEKNARIGDNWRNRYDALCLHDPVWYDHMPYLPFPPTWPVYTPAVKLANWLEHYAESLELNVWTSSSVVSASPAGDAWKATIKRGDGSERTFTVNHIVFATGLGSNDGAIPVYPGMLFLSSLEYQSLLGRHLALADVTMYQRSPTYIMSTKNGWDVLMGGTSYVPLLIPQPNTLAGVYSEDGPPSDIADRLSASFPHHMGVGLSQRKVKEIAELDKYASSSCPSLIADSHNPIQRDILDGLRGRGFLLTDGIHGTGFGLLAWSRAGGYYLDVGASRLITDGKIKLKSGSAIKRFTESGLDFEDGATLDADVVIFATGLGDSRSHLGKVCGKEVEKRLKPLWGLDAEGEINGAWRDLGVKGIWSMLGNLALCRFHSKHVAL